MNKIRNPIEKIKLKIHLFLIIMILIVTTILVVDIVKQLKIKDFVESLNHTKAINNKNINITTNGSYNFKWIPILGTIFLYMVISLDFYFLSNKQKDKMIIIYPFLIALGFLGAGLIYMLYLNISSQSNFYIKGIDNSDSLKGKNILVYNQVKSLFLGNEYLINKLAWVEFGFICFACLIAGYTFICSNKIKRFYNAPNIQL